MQTMNTRGADALRTNGSITTIGLCLAIALLEGLDLQSAGVAAPRIAKEFSLSVAQMGWAFSAGAIGLLPGAALGGRLADRLGRKRVLMLSVALFGGFSLATTLVWSFESLLAARLLTGLGLGAAMPNLIALCSEAASPGQRNTAVGAMYCGMPFGAALAAAIGIASPGDEGWRHIFYVGGFGPLLMVPLLALWLPESAQFVEAKSRSRYRSKSQSKSPATKGAEGSSGFVEALCGDRRTRTTIALWISYLGTLVVLYFLMNWLPSMVLSNGLTRVQAGVAMMMFNIGGGIGAVGIANVMDRFSPRLTVVGMYAGIAAALAGLAGAGGSVSMAWGAFFCGLFLVGGQSVLYASAPDEPVAADGAAQCAALIYTTGTTGAPKGVMLSHRNLLFIAATSSALRRVSPDDVVYTVLPVSHVYGLASVCLGSLYAGATLRLAPRFSPEAVRIALADEGVTIFQGVPAMHAKLLEHLHTHAHAWHAPRLRFAYSGGSPLDANLKARVERMYGVPLHNGYGMTESSPTITQTPLDAPRADCSVGMPIPGVEMRIVAPDGTDVPQGEVGEIRVRGPNVMLGYYRNADATRAAVSPDGWLSTGDLARQEADGSVTIAGRSKELIIRSGFNVYPVEVEQVLNAHPDVVQAAVVGRAVEGNEEVLAFVELVPGATATEDALQAWCAQRLAPYKRPARIRVLDALPAASTGKVLKHKLRELA